MKKSFLPSRLARLVGSDADWIYFITPSWSRSGLDHDINICKRTGEIVCSCEDASYRVKRPDLLDLLAEKPEAKEGACKHAIGLCVAYRRLLEP